MNSALRIGGFLLVVALINVTVRVVPFPAVDLPSFPDLPGWLHTLLKVKNVLLVGIIVTAIVVAVVQDDRKKKAR